MIISLAIWSDHIGNTARSKRTANDHEIGSSSLRHNHVNRISRLIIVRKPWSACKRFFFPFIIPTRHLFLFIYLCGLIQEKERYGIKFPQDSVIKLIIFIDAMITRGIFSINVILPVERLMFGQNVFIKTLKKIYYILCILFQFFYIIVYICIYLV